MLLVCNCSAPLGYLVTAMGAFHILLHLARLDVMDCKVIFKTAFDCCRVAGEEVTFVLHALDIEI